jgi:hypothetical protein
VADDHATTSEPQKQEKGGRNGGGAEFAALRRLLVGPEQNRLEELATELRKRHVSAADMAEHLPEAIVLRGKRDRQIGRALAPTVETALRESIRRNPREIATAIFPILGPAIRKAIAETMSALVRSINSAVEHSFSARGIRWRIESWRTGVPYPQVVIKHALLYRVEEAFLIHAETGLLIAHATAPGLKVPDADLISGMLTAIQDFVRDSFRPADGATLRTFSVGDHTVQVEAGPMALLALVIRGEAPSTVLRKQQDTLEMIHLQFASQLAEFSGDTAPLQSAQPLLEECLETVVDTGAHGRGEYLWMRWVIPLAIAAVALLVVLIRANSRFDRAVATLENEPGLVVLEARRGWLGWVISGLRDPTAREPQVVLAGAGLVPRALKGRWEPYMSLDSGVVVTRARQQWALPGTTLLSLKSDSLTVSGDLPLESLGMIRQRGLPPGVSDVIVSDSRVILPPHLDSIRRAIVEERILFAPGIGQANLRESARARAVATQVRLLADSVGAHDADLTLTIIGRTDPTGSDETNQALAQWRVDHVAAIFAALGVRPDYVRGEPVATSRPLSAADSVVQARINRSVSFEIDVSTRPRTTRGR